MSFLLRPVSPADAGALQAIYAHHVRHGLASFEVEPPSVDEMATRMSRILADGFPYLVVEAGGHVLGYSYASHFRTRPAYRYTVEDSVYVAPEATGQGIGRRLLMELIARCEALGFRQMIAVIGDSANAASIGVHHACGFGKMSVFEATGFKFGRWVDTVLMQRALGEGASTLPAR